MNTSINQLSRIDVSVVVIGRNEGERLQRCFESVRQAHWDGLNFEIIYVDSGSSDNSVLSARRFGAQVFVLEDASPCAAKARNLGWKNAQAEIVLFLDGDTELAPGFVRAACPQLSDPTLCAIWGHRRESHPEQSVYNLVLDLDWIYPTGITPYFGGDVLVRRRALDDVNGFDPELKAGEEPEMCARMRAKGWRILHIDEAMTRHDLAIQNFKAWARRCYRSGIAYAEVAQRMKLLGDPMWQSEARRDLMHGGFYVVTLVLWPLLLWQSTWLALVPLVGAFFLVARTAVRSRWKSRDTVTLWLYAFHSHLQKIPALVGQLAWYRARRRHTVLELVEYKSSEEASHIESSGRGQRGHLKLALSNGLTWIARLHRLVWQPWQRMWAYTRLREALDGNLSPSCVVLDSVELHGTRRIRIGNNALIYPGVYLETQGDGVIEIGNRVVLSRGVHIVAFDRVVISDDCLVGEYSSIRDANHRTGTSCTRDSGYDSAPIVLGPNVWLGRGVTVLKGCNLGEHVVVGANAVVTSSLFAHSTAVGIPARVNSNPIT
jgi:acetyltransferase-like isoleucine patch superfamily enzyme/cellulose synthase/poly-beta-1,6-N-acetylglucosamine synthase-like glycosyltransferase